MQKSELRDTNIIPLLSNVFLKGLYVKSVKISHLDFSHLGRGQLESYQGRAGREWKYLFPQLIGESNRVLAMRLSWNLDTVDMWPF